MASRFGDSWGASICSAATTTDKGTGGPACRAVLPGHGPAAGVRRIDSTPPVQQHASSRRKGYIIVLHDPLPGECPSHHVDIFVGHQVLDKVRGHDACDGWLLHCKIQDGFLEGHWHALRLGVVIYIAPARHRLREAGPPPRDCSRSLHTHRPASRRDCAPHPLGPVLSDRGVFQLCNVE